MKRWQYDTACEPAQLVTERLRDFPLKPNALVYGWRVMFSVIIRVCLRIYNRFEIIGQEELRTNRSLVIVANHSSHLDTLCLLAALPLRKLNQAFPTAAADYFYQNFSRIWIAGVVNALPFARDLHARRSLSICSDLISEPGNILIIFPEGTRSTTGQIQEFKPGISALVAGRDVSVVPCYLQGAFESWPKGKRIPRPKKIRLIVGAPRNYASRTADKAELCSIASELRLAVEKLRETK